MRQPQEEGLTEIDNINFGNIGPARQELIEVDKDPRWWLWRGFLGLTKGDRSVADPTLHALIRLKGGFIWQYVIESRIDGTEQLWSRVLEVGFPSMKPDIDIYGIPPRTRSQRGWYHVHRPPCLLCSSFPLATAPMPTTGTAPLLPASTLR